MDISEPWHQQGGSRVNFASNLVNDRTRAKR